MAKIDKYEIATPRMQQENTGMHLYRMKMRFKCDLSIKEINNMLSFMNETLRPCLKNAGSFTMEITMPFIPDPDMINDITKIIADEYRGENLEASNMQFTGYDYLYEIVRENDTKMQP